MQCNINVLVDIVFPLACTQGKQRERERGRESEIGKGRPDKEEIFEREVANRSSIDQPVQGGEIPSLGP